MNLNLEKRNIFKLSIPAAAFLALLSAEQCVAECPQSLTKKTLHSLAGEGSATLDGQKLTLLDSNNQVVEEIKNSEKANLEREETVDNEKPKNKKHFLHIFQSEKSKNQNANHCIYKASYELFDITGEKKYETTFNVKVEKSTDLVE